MDVISEKMKVPQYMFKLSGLGSDGRGYVTGTMLNPLSFAGSNSFSTSGDMVRQGDGGLVGIADRLMAKGSDLVNNKLIGRQMGGYGKYNKSETRLKWTDSTKPQISCEFTLLANTAAEAEKNMETIKLIKSATLPINAKGALLAPLGYKGHDAGTLIFTLGTWLVMPKLVMVQESCVPSVQVMSNGYPLYWNCAFNVEPYETITVDDFRRYFQQPAILSRGPTTAVSDSSLPSVLQNKNLSNIGIA